MNHYQWKGRLPSGQRMRGVIEAQSVAYAKVLLRQQGIVTHNIIKKHPPLFNQRTTSHDISRFIRDLATLSKAGIPLIDALNMLYQEQTKLALKRRLLTIKHDLEKGLMLAESLKKHPSCFNSLVCHLIHTGEESGTLDLMLRHITDYQEKMATIKQKLKTIITYPLAVLVLTMLVTTGLLIFVVPQFQSLFRSFGAQLPPLTQSVIDLSQWLKAYWFYLICFIMMTVYGFFYAIKRYESVSMGVHRAILKLPIAGNVIQKIIVARLARTLSITFSAGLPLTHALMLIADVAGNRWYAKAIHEMRQDISRGESLQRAIQNTQRFPRLVVQMVGVGEASGSLDDRLNQLACLYEEDVNHMMGSLSSVLEPVIMSILGIMVGVLMLAMYLPILKLGEVV